MSRQTFLMHRLLVAFFLLPLAVISTVMISRGWMQKFQAESLRALPVHQSVMPFSLIDQNGAAVTLASLAGKVWIGDFIFTRCAGPCPVMTRAMKVLDSEIHEPDARFVSFTVDPDYDTPERLKNYLAKFDANPERWLFLTGDKQTLHDLSIKSFYLGVTEVPEAEREAPDQTVTHSTRFVLVDRLGRLRGYYDGTDAKALKQLVRDARVLLRNS